MTALRLQKLEIENCEEALLNGYYDWGTAYGVAPADSASRSEIAHRGYDLYDGCPAQSGFEIGPAEIFLSVGINSRLALPDACRILALRERARPLLARISDDARLEDADDDQLDAAAKLMTLLEEAEHIGRGKVTKVLHKKRPAFIPIVDSVVADFLWKNFPWRLHGASPARDVLLVFRDILLARQDILETVQANMGARGFSVTTVRVLEALIWLGWHERNGGGGFGTPITTLWAARSLADARRVAERLWRAQGCLTSRRREHIQG